MVAKAIAHESNKIKRLTKKDGIGFSVNGRRKNL
jgi:hypothetical protein